MAANTDPNQLQYLRSQTLRSISIIDPSSGLPVSAPGSMHSGGGGGDPRLAGAASQQGMAALISAVLEDPQASAELKRFAALARADMLSSTLSAPAVGSSFQQLLPAKQPGGGGGFFSLGGEGNSPRLPVSVVAAASAGGAPVYPGQEITSDLLHPS